MIFAIIIYVFKVKPFAKHYSKNIDLFTICVLVHVCILYSKQQGSLKARYSTALAVGRLGNIASVHGEGSYIILILV